MFNKTVKTLTDEYVNKAASLRKTYFTKLMGVVKQCNTRIDNADKGIEALEAEKSNAKDLRNKASEALTILK